MAQSGSSQEIPEVSERNNRRFSVSSNRGRARHRIHYVETGGALVDNEECTFCQFNPADHAVLREHPDESSQDPVAANKKSEGH